jgi:hypothetical protein
MASEEELAAMFMRDGPTMPRNEWTRARLLQHAAEEYRLAYAFRSYVLSTVVDREAVKRLAEAIPEPPTAAPRQERSVSEKTKRIVYRSAGTDDVSIVCSTVEEAINCFLADAEVMLEGGCDGVEISLSVTEMTDEQMEALEEV